MRFVPEGEEEHHFSMQTDPTLTISNRVKEIADLVEKQLIEDDVSKSSIMPPLTCMDVCLRVFIIRVSIEQNFILK
jgi:hypothetical protein